MVEMAGTAQLERQGVTAQTFPVGTVISVKVNPLREAAPPAHGSAHSPVAPRIRQRNKPSCRKPASTAIRSPDIR
jgi:hypothetical protein